jgi:hypothetical protein
MDIYRIIGTFTMCAFLGAVIAVSWAAIFKGKSNRVPWVAAAIFSLGWWFLPNHPSPIAVTATVTLFAALALANVKLPKFS